MNTNTSENGLSSRKFADIIERIEYFRNYQGLNKSRFSAEIGMKPQTYNNFIGAQGSKPNIELIHGIVTRFGVNPVWLLTGKGAMLLEGAEARRGGFGAGQAPAYVAERDEAVDALRQRVDTLEARVRELTERLERAEATRNPLLQQLIAAVQRYQDVDPSAANEELRRMVERVESHLAR